MHYYHIYFNLMHTLLYQPFNTAVSTVYFFIFLLATRTLHGGMQVKSTNRWVNIGPPDEDGEDTKIIRGRIICTNSYAFKEAKEEEENEEVHKQRKSYNRHYYFPYGHKKDIAIDCYRLLNGVQQWVTYEINTKKCKWISGQFTKERIFTSTMVHIYISDYITRLVASTS